MNVVIYTRVSTDEQKEKGFSLSEQESRLRKYCRDKGYKIIRHFEDDHSAKDFNRPGFNKMLTCIEGKTIKPDLLICVRVDRFSRNAFETMKMVQRLNRHKVEVEYVEGFIKNDMPEDLLIEMISIVLPQIENERRGINTKRGLREAQRNGRWITKAPKGYKFDRSSGTSLLVPNNDAIFIKEAYAKYATGAYAKEEIRKELNKAGFKCSKQHLCNILKNPVYTGKIRIKAWKNEPEVIVDGIHEGIVSEEIFEIVQEVNKRRRIQPYNKKTIQDEFPLRGYLICNNCGRNMTGSGSRSRNRNKYYYYHCNYCGNLRFRADRSNKKFLEYLRTLNVKSEVLELYMAVLRDVFTLKEGRNNKVRLFEDQLAEAKSMMEQVEDKFFSNQIDLDTYHNAKDRYKKNIYELEEKIQNLYTVRSDYDKYISDGLPLLQNIDEYFEKASTTTKQRIIGSIFPGKLIFNGNNYRTARMNEVLSLILSNDKALQGVEAKKADNFVDQSSKAPLKIQLSNQFYHDLRLLYDLKPYIESMAI